MPLIRQSSKGWVWTAAGDSTIKIDYNFIVDAVGTGIWPIDSPGVVGWWSEVIRIWTESASGLSCVSKTNRIWVVYIGEVWTVYFLVCSILHLDFNIDWNKEKFLQGWIVEVVKSYIEAGTSWVASKVDYPNNQRRGVVGTSRISKTDNSFTTARRCWQPIQVTGYFLTMNNPEIVQIQLIKL